MLVVQSACGFVWEFVAKPEYLPVFARTRPDGTNRLCSLFARRARTQGYTGLAKAKYFSYFSVARSAIADRALVSATFPPAPRYLLLN